MTKEEEMVSRGGGEEENDKELMELDFSSLVLRFPDIPTTQPLVNKGHYSIGRSDDGTTNIRRLRRRSLDASFYGNLNKPTMISEEELLQETKDAQTILTDDSDKNNSGLSNTDEVMEAFEAPEDKPAPIITPLIIDAAASTNNSNLSSPSKTMPPFEFELLTRGVKKQLSQQEQQGLAASLLSLPQDEAASHLTKAYAHNESLLADLRRKNAFTAFFKPGNQIPQIQLSKHFLDFGIPSGGLAPLNKPLQDTLLVSCKLGNAKLSIQTGKPAKTHTLKITPQTAIIKRKTSLAINFTLEIRTTIALRQALCMDIEGVGRFFILISINSEKSIFGMDIKELGKVVDADNGLSIPSVLYTMKRFLYDHGGLIQEGVFRLAGDELETMEVKSKLNDGTFTTCNDVNCIANLIKVFFRELPDQVLNELPPSTFLSSDDEASCVNAYETLLQPGVKKDLLDWLLDLLADVALQEPINKMNSRNLAIVVAPNLFQADDDGSMNPMESLTLSQKVVNFVYQVLNFKVKSKMTKSEQ
eukprot:TRINITY_DN2163_c0_g1_i1.p1 TRINITY_DN2163_c0_g1~~TRINITY_DN2163_c0_g1_i1.p1  ORF type:complete len:530 (-),score=106.95 TRINITY_DN2163_c0_g1_i1:57-1646(-)